MTRASKSLMGLAAGVLLMVASVYSALGGVAFVASCLGLLTSVISVGFLLSTQSSAAFGRPHPWIWLLFGLALGLHGYENLSHGSGSLVLGFLGWALAPHVLALVLSCFRATRLPAVAGAAAALLLDAWTFHAVFIAPTSSTAALALIWIPLWNILIVVPVATWIAWLFNRRRQPAAPAD